MGFKSLWQKEELLIMGHFSFSSIVFKQSPAAEASESVCKWERVNLQYLLISDTDIKSMPYIIGGSAAGGFVIIVISVIVICVKARRKHRLNTGRG